MEDIVTSHAKDLEELSHHLGKVAGLCECLMDKFLSKEMEYLTSVQRALEQENKKLRKSVEDWKSRYESKEKELDEMKLGYSKPRREVDSINGDILWQDMLDWDLNVPKTTLEDLPRPQVVPEKTASKDKGKAPMITPPNSGRKTTTKKKKSPIRDDPQPMKIKRKRKIIPSSDGDDDNNILPTFCQTCQPGPSSLKKKKNQDKLKDKQDTVSNNVDAEGEWDDIALRPKKVMVLGSSGMEKRNDPPIYRKEKWGDAIDLTI